MPKIYATRGLPGSSKTTLAKMRCADGSGMIVERDEIRFRTYGVYFGPPIDENAVTRIQDADVAEILEKGLDVWISDTNLTSRARKHCEDLAAYHDVELVWIDLTHIPPQTCIERDAKRDRQVGEAVIMNMFNKFIKPYPYAGGR